MYGILGLIKKGGIGKRHKSLSVLDVAPTILTYFGCKPGKKGHSLF